jgi:hypothetical protein
VVSWAKKVRSRPATARRVAIPCWSLGFIAMTISLWSRKPHAPLRPGTSGAADEANTAATAMVPRRSRADWA